MFFTELKTVLMVFRMPSTTVVIAVLIPFHMVVTTDLIALNTVETTEWIAFSTVEIRSYMAPHTVLKKSLIAVKIVVMTELTAFTAVETALWIAFHAPIRMSLQFSQMNWKGREMMSTAASKIEPMNITAVCTTLQIVFQTDWMCSHRPVKKDFRPSIATPMAFTTF